MSASTIHMAANKSLGLSGISNDAELLPYLFTHHEENAGSDDDFG